jgi:hypothetical protein
MIETSCNSPKKRFIQRSVHDGQYAPTAAQTCKREKDRHLVNVGEKDGANLIGRPAISVNRCSGGLHVPDFRKIDELGKRVRPNKKERQRRPEQVGESAVPGKSEDSRKSQPISALMPAESRALMPRTGVSRLPGTLPIK